MRVLLITGTGTGVGKTVATAAVTACALRAGLKVAVVKPVQTGVTTDEPGDLAEVRRQTGNVDLHELRRYDEPLAPATAARRQGVDGIGVADIAGYLRTLADRDLVIVEGAGGALVRFNSAGETVLDLGVALANAGEEVDVLLVASAGLGVLNVAALTARAIARAGLRLRGVVIGAFPAEPELAERCNLADIADYAGAPLLGVLPDGLGRAGTDGTAEFADIAAESLAPQLGGRLSATEFIDLHNPIPVTRGPAS